MVVVGAGHAGCEAALAAARMGCKTLLLTLNLDRIAWQVRGLARCSAGSLGPGGGRLPRARSLSLEALRRAQRSLAA